jgi:hypothetical protein
MTKETIIVIAIMLLCMAAFLLGTYAQANWIEKSKRADLKAYIEENVTCIYSMNGTECDYTFIKCEARV